MAVYIFPVPIDHDRFEKVFEEFSNDFGLFVGLFFLFNLWEIWEAASPDCESMAEKTLQSFQSNRLTSGKYVESVAEKRGKTIFDAARATTICLRVARWNQSSPAAFFFHLTCQSSSARYIESRLSISKKWLSTFDWNSSVLHFAFDLATGWSQFHLGKKVLID